MNCYTEWGFHARGVYSTQNTSPIGTERVKQEGETDKGTIEKEE